MSEKTENKMDDEESRTDDNAVNSKPLKKVKNPGVIYLNYIPRYMTVKKVREIFSAFGEVRRLFLKPEKTKPGKPSKFFSEGWVEFTRKKVAKQVAECLNGTQVGGKRHSPYYDALWSIKYLPKFQWSNLSEKKAYEKSRKMQRMKAEIAQVKREVNFYSKEVEKKKRMENKKIPREPVCNFINKHILKTEEQGKLLSSNYESNMRDLLLLNSIFTRENGFLDHLN